MLDMIVNNENKKDRIAKGIKNVYQEITTVFDKRKDDTHYTVEIIAYTSFTIEPELQVWKSNGYLHDMTLSIFHMNKEFIKNSSEIDFEWMSKVEHNTKLINEFINENATEFNSKNVKINLYEYNHIPGIHGVRIRNEKTVVSFSKWNLANGHIKMPNDEEWFVINKEEVTNRGNLLNNLFDNWVTALEKRRK